MATKTRDPLSSGIVSQLLGGAFRPTIYVQPKENQKLLIHILHVFCICKKPIILVKVKFKPVYLSCYNIN